MLQVVPINKTSSNIKAVFHDPDTQELTVEFNHGGTYVYSGVSVDKAAGFTDADSPGNYLHTQIKNQHDYKKL